jgi:hypothetical protein
VDLVVAGYLNKSTSLELLNIMDSDRPVTAHNEWKKSFHDEVDAGSERSDAGLITEDPSRRWSKRRVQRLSVRLVVECILVVSVVGLSASLVMQKMREYGRLTSYGPSCESATDIPRQIWCINQNSANQESQIWQCCGNWTRSRLCRQRNAVECNPVTGSTRELAGIVPQ